MNVYDNVTKFDLLPPGIYTGGTLVEDCEDAWNEVSPTGCTITAGTANKVVGTNCVKIAMAANAAAGIIASEAMSSTDLSGKNYLTCYIMCTKGVAAGALQLCIDDTAECASPVKSLDIPALEPGIMNYVILPLGTPGSGQDAIISVGLKMVTDLGACDIYIDQVQAWSGRSLIGPGVNVRDYEGLAKLVLSVTGVSAGTTKTMDIAIKESNYLNGSYAALSPAKAFTQVTTSAGSEELSIDLSHQKPYIRAEVTLGSADCSYTLALHGYGVKKYLGY